jgi:hypothetical protein
MASIGMLLLVGASARAQTSVGPFSGLHEEDFESSMTIASGYASNSVFGGNGTYHTSSAYRTTGWSYSCSMWPNAGAWFVGDNGGLMWFEFSTAPTKFGGYFGSNQPGTPVSVNVRFYNASSTLLYFTTSVLQNDCTWQWLGWDISALTGVHRIEFETVTGAGFLMMDDLQLDLPVVTTCGTTFCFGDGSGAACPCGNTGTGGGGCASSASSGGGRLNEAPGGSCSYSVDDAGLVASDLPTNGWALVFQGNSTLGGGGSPFADGVLCVGGPYLGLQFLMADGLGVAQTSRSLVDASNLMGLGPGSEVYYQCYYHDPIGPCGTNWNLTNGVRWIWTP